MLAQEAVEVAAEACAGFNIPCDTLLTGAGVTIAGIVLFVGSVYILLAAIFGRWLGYLVLMVAFSGWMIIQSALWLFGFWSQGPETPTNLGPRGKDPAWAVVAAGSQTDPEQDEIFASYPGEPWAKADLEDDEEAAAFTSVNSTATAFMAERANEELGLSHEDLEAITPSAFTVDSILFADDDGGEFAVAVAHFAGGGPRTTLSIAYQTGAVPRYSYMFLAGSIVLFAIHLPLLDRAEKSRKEFLTGGSAPAWYGPA